MKLNWILPALLCAAGTSLPAAPAVTDNPYGICAHVSRGPLADAEKDFQKLHEANINWVRTDFDWDRVEKKQGEWNFTHLDKVIELAVKEKINILPILDYDVAWAHPAWKHLDLWSDYVRRTVSRYAKELRCWEVWNEQNHSGLWRDQSNAANYVQLLKRTYEEIKKIDPELTVVYGGTAGVPLSYIEDSLKAGAGNYFDAMNIHPYNWQGTPELMIPQLTALQALLKKYGVGDKPVWITEVGWSTAQPPAFFREVLPPVFRRAGIDPATVTAALVCDPGAGYPGAEFFDTERNFPMFRNREKIRLSQLKNLSVTKYPVLIPTVNEEFPGAFIPDLVDYVKRGGTLLLPSGLPFYYDIRLGDGASGAKRVQVNDKFLKAFHIGWEAWWTGKDIPERESYMKPAPGFENTFKAELKSANRFLHARNLAPGDEFIPVIEAGTDKYKSATLALYKLNSDLKGNVIVCTSMSVNETVSEERQAEMLPRTYLIALAHGVPRTFWYNFRSGEWKTDEREAHFGIVHRNLDSKPAFRAYRALTELCPSGSTVPELKNSGNVYLAGWTRPDGVRVWAVWTALSTEKIRLDIKGKVAEAHNHLGESRPIPNGEYSANPSILYLVGPEAVTVGGR